MLKPVLAAAIAMAFVTATPLAAMAQAPQTQTAKPPKSAATKKRTLSAGQQAAHDRQKKCGAEWKEAKAGGKVAKGMKWPKYWSECNTRLKAQGA
jgi:Ni/Co efflux regulator RcnB